MVALNTQQCGDTDDLTNTPDELLANGGRDFCGRRRVPQLQWFTIIRSGVKEAADCCELSNLIDQNLLHTIIEQPKNTRATCKYPILANEIRDASGTEQLSVCLRWVDKHQSKHEDLR